LTVFSGSNLHLLEEIEVIAGDFNARQDSLIADV
jgi:hypothetical protein